jgi:hypothetical protein
LLVVRNSLETCAKRLLGCIVGQYKRTCGLRILIRSKYSEKLSDSEPPPPPRNLPPDTTAQHSPSGPSGGMFDDDREERREAQPTGGGVAPPGANIPGYLLPASIAATLLCCLPTGIAAIVYSSQARSKSQAGDTAGASEAARKAQMWLIISVVLGLVGGFIYLIAIGGSGY